MYTLGWAIQVFSQANSIYIYKKNLYCNMEEALEQRKTGDGEPRSETIWKGVLRLCGGMGKGSAMG